MTTPAFTLRFSPTPRGARLARRLASQQTDAWGWAYGSPVHDTVELVVAELAANAVTHGRVPGRDAELRLTAEPGSGLVRIEVSDARGERQPRPETGDTEADGGRGLLLVAALTDAWGVVERLGGPGKTVWAVISAKTDAVPVGDDRSPDPLTRFLGTYAADDADPAGARTG
ncbi:ATP-binding protein [Streptomyces pratens]|uniref:ATP-binding protein n=1 Tax=Streptomyces pratens TaxID=887456 RepID=A0ABW1M125_9ACTN